VALTPDTTGRIDGTTNSVGIKGAWYPYGDSIGPDGAAPGDCQNAGHSADECSVVTAPGSATGGFAPIGGMGMCTSGTAAKVISGSDGSADYSHIWGAGIAVDLNNSGGTSATRMPYDAVQNRVTGFEFDLDTQPPRPQPGANYGGLHIEFPTPVTLGQSAYWADVSLGHNVIFWSQLFGPFDAATGTLARAPAAFDQSQLLSVEFLVSTAVGSSLEYTFCINNLTAMTE
jgi:hypothetical protein